MKNLHISLKKILMLLCLLAMFPFAILLTACDNGGGTPMPVKSIINIDCAVREGNANYTVVNHNEIQIAQGVDIYNLVSNEDLIVTIYYSDGTNEILKSGYNFSIVDHTNEGMYYDYTIEVSYPDSVNPIYPIYVTTETEVLPMFNNITPIGGVYSGYNFIPQTEFRYTGQQYDVDGMITTDDETTVLNLVADGKVTLEGTYQATEPNQCYNGNEYDWYSFTIRANRGYQWKIDGQIVDSLVVNWQIKRQIIPTPTITSGTTFTYQHRAETVNGETTYVGVPQGLTFNFSNGSEQYFEIYDNEQTNASSYYTANVVIPDTYNDLYTMMVNGEESNSVSFEWRINPMVLAAPTVDQTHYFYTGNEIQPTLTSDYLDLFDVSYSYQSSVNAMETPYVIYVSLKPEYSYSSYNYSFTGVQFEYFIDRAEFPTQIKNEIKNIGFVLEREFNYDYTTYQANQTYAEYVRWLSINDFVNSVEDLAKFQIQSSSECYSNFEFALPDEMPIGLTADSCLNVGTYPVKITYWYDTINYQPYTFDATLSIKPHEIPINTGWSHWVDGNDSVADSNIIYNDQAIYRYQLTNINDKINVVYTIYYGTTENNIDTPVNKILDVGYYRIVATLTAPNNDTSNFLIYDENYIDQKEPISSLTYPNIIHVNKQPLEVWAYFDQNDEFYYQEDAARSINLPTFHETHGEDFVDIVNSVIYYRTGASAAWTIAENTINVGEYKTVYILQIKDALAVNYELNLTTLEQNWFIYPNTYELVTTDRSSAYYIGWTSTSEITLHYDGVGNYDESDFPVTKPNGLGVKYMYDDNPIYNDVNEHWETSGSHNSYAPTDLGNYLVKAEFYVKNITGWEDVTILINGTPVTVDEFYRNVCETEDKHFEIVE